MSSINIRVWLAVCAGLLLVTLWRQSLHAQAPAGRVAIDNDDIGGVVTGAKGPEAGVWVIAETADFQTKFRKIVVTDDAGRYVLPDLPAASYQIWVRGYGLVDSPKVQARPGQNLNLKAVPAPDPHAAAQYYPANYWYSLVKIPGKDQFPMKVPLAARQARMGVGGRVPAAPARERVIASQEEWIDDMKGCLVCHQMGDKATRELPPGLGKFDSTFQGWERRLRIGAEGGSMEAVNQLGHDPMISLYADWTDRIVKGEIPAQAPPRPQGAERNLVLSVWDAGTPTTFMHDVISTDKRNPSINANGKVYGADYHNGLLVILDPKTNTNETIQIPTREPRGVVRPGPMRPVQVPSVYWGEEDMRDDAADPNAIMMDEKARVWTTSTIRQFDNPPVCKAGSDNPFAKQYPIEGGTRHLSYYDPQTKVFKDVFTCFRTHHLMFANDADRTIYADGGGLVIPSVIGWVNTRMIDEGVDEIKAQGWCAAYLDTNGDGKIDPRVDKPVLGGGVYSVQPSTVDDSIWGAVPGIPGSIIRMTKGKNPPETCRFENYEPPYDNPKVPGMRAYRPRGIDIDSNGVVWTSLAGSSQFASFDRRKCKVLNGPTATGQHCPEGWTLYPYPGPTFKGVGQTTAEWSYYNWVDKFDTFGVGKNTPLANGTNSDQLMMLNPATKQFTMLRVPYPMGFYQRGMDGRIDDPNTGWKGRGLWASDGSRTPWHLEQGGKGQLSLIVHFQMRPNPLAK